MTRIRPGQPGHGGRTACLRLRPARIINGVAQGGWTDIWEIICPACGDDINLDYVTVSPFLQRVRGSYRNEADGLTALRAHRGEATAKRPAPEPAAAAPAAPAAPAPGQEEVTEELPAHVGAGTDSGSGQRF